MILLTGTTGAIGAELARRLGDRGRPFRAMVRDERKAGALRDLGATIVVADMSRPETLPAAVEGVERAFLLTPLDTRQVEWKSAFIEAAKSEAVLDTVREILGRPPRDFAGFVEDHARAFAGR